MGILIAAAGHRRLRVIGLAAAILAAGAVPAAALSAGTYRGRTSQHEQASARVQAGTVRTLRIAWIAYCTRTQAVLGTAAHPLATVHTNISLTRQGRWSARGAYTASSGNGYTERFHVSDHGAVTARHGVRGVFTGKVRVYDTASGAYVDTCSSGRITFTARRAG